MELTIEVRELTTQDREWVQHFLLTHNKATRVVSRGRMHQADRLPGFVAFYEAVPSGLLTYHLAEDELETTREKARQIGCRRLWLITTNDNAPAIRFYQRRGMRLVAVHRNAIRESRKLKPEIPITGLGGIPIEDEIEFEFPL
jgi:hypothetical protein